MKTITYIIAAIIIITVFSCTEDLETDYKGKSTNMLVIDGSISTDTTAHKVILSRSVDNTSDEVIYETGALVSISDSINVFNLAEYEPGIYLTDSNVYGIPGRTYTLNIITEDGNTYEASSKLNPVSEIDSIRFVKEYFNFADMYFYKVYFYGQESPEPGQYYLWNLYLNDSLVNDTVSETMFQDDSWVNGSYMKDFDVYWIPEEVLKDDTTVVTLEMMSITEDYYWYLLEVMHETTWRGSPWDPIPANVSTNISEGAVGFFVAKAKTRESVIYYRQEED